MVRADGLAEQKQDTLKRAVQLWLTASRFDQVYAAAKELGLSVSPIVDDLMLDLLASLRRAIEKRAEG